jgi:hypothetical protein
VSESPHFADRSRPVETLSFMWQNEGIHLYLYETDDLRGALKPNAERRSERANADTLRQLISSQEPE